MQSLEQIYLKDGLEQFFRDEKIQIPKILEKISEQLSGRYDISGPLAVGGTGIVFMVRDRFSHLDRILKFSRPLVQEESVSKAIKDEGLKLMRLRHENIVGVHEVDLIEYEKDRYAGYTITDFIDGEDWKKNILRSLEEHDTPGPTIDLLLTIVYDAVKGLEYIHNNSFVHMDIKPTNVLLSSKGTAKIADLGFAKQLMDDPSGATTIGFSKHYAHPTLLDYHFVIDDDNRATATIPRKQFSKQWDIYALGQSVLEMLALIDNKFPDEAIHRPRFRYIHLMACRMLDSRNTSAHHYFNEFAINLTNRTLGELHYSDCTEIRQDIEKEIGILVPAHEIPELNYHSRETIHGSESRTTIFTPRLKEIIQHPLFSRLSRISQLGLVRFLYPTASHTRLDHVLGTHTNACAYVDALYHDENPLFRQLINKPDIDALLLASLFHDLGQYPMAHDLEDVDQGFKHTFFTEALLNHGMTDSKGRTLKEIIEAKDGWNVKVNTIKDILKAQGPSPSLLQPAFRAKLLSTIIDGPIDADKTDYLMRDSQECRLKYGRAIDFERLMKTITVDYDHNMESVSLAIYDKGRPCAESIAFTRYLMFSSVYWHHTSRAYKTMIQYAFRLILAQLDSKGREQFKSEFQEFVVSLRAQPTKKRATSLIDELNTDGLVNYMAETDLACLDWMYQRAPPASREILKKLASRQLYKRLASLHFSKISATESGGRGTWDTFQDISTDWSLRLKLCQRLQSRLLVDVRAHAPEHHSTSLNTESLSKLDVLMGPEHLSILVDIPPVRGVDLPLKFVKETMEDRYLNYLPSNALSQISELWTGPIGELFKSIGVVRIFCHESVRRTIIAVLNAETIVKIAGEELNTLRSGN